MPTRRINHQRLFKRFSQITGVPLKEIYPRIENPTHREFSKTTVIGGYDNSRHIVQYRHKRPAKHVKEHEERHALQVLSNPSITQKFRRKYKALMEKKGTILDFMRDYIRFDNEAEKTRRVWIEPTNVEPKIKEIPSRALSNMSDEFIKSIEDSKLADRLRRALENREYREQIVRHISVRRIFQRHEEDGLLLLWVAPPKKLDALEIEHWEKEMVQNEYLLPRGGLTKKGLRYWREHLQPQAIWQFLKEAKERRSEQNTTR